MKQQRENNRIDITDNMYQDLLWKIQDLPRRQFILMHNAFIGKGICRKRKDGATYGLSKDARMYLILLIDIRNAWRSDCWDGTICEYDSKNYLQIMEVLDRLRG